MLRGQGGYTVKPVLRGQGGYTIKPVLRGQSGYTVKPVLRGQGGYTVKPVLRGHLLGHRKSGLIGDLLKNVQFIWNFLWQDEKKWLLNRGDRMCRFDCISYPVPSSEIMLTVLPIGTRIKKRYCHGTYKLLILFSGYYFKYY